jgi:hypothetical protein
MTWSRLQYVKLVQGREHNYAHCVQCVHDICDANHIAQPCRLDHLKPLNSSGLILDSFRTCSRFVPLCKGSKNPSIVLHVDLLFSMFFRINVFRFFGLLIFAAQTPIMTDGLACDSSINCIKDSRCRIRMPSDCVLETPRVLSFESPVSLFHLRLISRSHFLPCHLLLRLCQSNWHCPLDARALL